MYGKDRLTQPLLRMKTVNMTKKANLPQSPGIRPSIDGREIQNRPERKRAGIDRYVGSGQWTIWEGYAASKLFKAASVRTTSTRTRVTVWRRQ